MPEKYEDREDLINNFLLKLIDVDQLSDDEMRRWAENMAKDLEEPYDDPETEFYPFEVMDDDGD